MMLDTLTTIQESNLALEARYADKLLVNPKLSRQLVSFQANKNKPGYRWFKYKEGFSEPLVHYLLDYAGLDSGRLLDPFAGTGTALFAASERGLSATGIELLPVGCDIMRVRQLAESDQKEELRVGIQRWLRESPWRISKSNQIFAHLRITHGAFPDEMQASLERYLGALKSEATDLGQLLRFAAMCILEEISFTRKDGQYLRWDYRSERRQGKKPFDKGYIATFDDAIEQKLQQIAADLEPNHGMLDLFSHHRNPGVIDIMCGSCLNVLPTLAAASFDGIITSPPYCNRYDYTRTYALELALLGVGEEEIRVLRQAMVSCTIENREKTGLRSLMTPSVFQRATEAFDSQHELRAIIDYLEWQKTTKVINNPGIPRMIRNYFFETALVIFEAQRVLKPNAPFIMVNDNVRYGGATIPVDLILSNFAEQAGFNVEVIWVLPTGKGNSSQQMGAHGREEARKCIYIWRRKAD